MNKDILIHATIKSLLSVRNPRLFRTERGYQGEFYCSLQNVLKKAGIIHGNCILEMEYQKSARHQTHQRPDIILHVPVEISGAAVTKNNYAVWALKRKASNKNASDDFIKLDEMFQLNYPLGFFVNIDSGLHYLDNYVGDFKDRLITFSVQLTEPSIAIKMAYWKENTITEVDIK